MSERTLWRVMVVIAVLGLTCAGLLFRINLPFTAWVLIAYLTLMAWVGPIGYEALLIYWHFLLYVILFCYALEHGVDLKRITIGAGLGLWAWRHHQANDPLKNLPPAVYQPANSGDTLPLPKK